MKLLKGVKGALTDVFAVLMAGMVLFSGYALWSNNAVYRDTQDVYDELLVNKPAAVEESTPDYASAFQELKQINPDIWAWLTVDKTGIDYPVVQGEDNLYYMSRDIYGNYSLSGSIFLDSRNNAGLDEKYLVIYGHHVDRGLMFGDLDKFLDREFFDGARDASILTEDGETEYAVLAVIEAIDSSSEIFDPSTYSGDLTGLEGFLKEHALFTWETSMNELAEYPDSSQVVALVTCTAGQTGARLVVFLYRRTPVEETTTEEQTTTEIPDETTPPPEETTKVPDETTPPEETTGTPDETTLPPSPPTSDNSHFMLWLMTMIFSATALVLIIRKKISGAGQ